MTAGHYPLLVKRDLDGFVGLFIDNLVQLLAIVGLCGALCGMTGDNARFIYAHILPGAAVSILFGNVFYAWQARRLARRQGRTDVTALPYGINTPSLIVYIVFVMEPTYARTQDAALAWKMGLVACLGSGVIELAGAFVAETIRRRTPRAALLATLAGIAIGFISMTFALQIFQEPLIAMLPLALILLTLFSQSPFPLGVPGGLVAIAAGTAIAWTLTGVQAAFPDAPDWLTVSAMNADLSQILATAGLWLPQWAGGEILSIFQTRSQDVLGMLTVIVPMGLFNVIGSLQNIESAEVGGDNFDTRSSLAMNGLGTILAAFFGSCFPTTIYIGHPGWKSLGARTAYSTINGFVITLICLFGVVGILNAVIPMEAGIAIVLWIGIIITAQAFQATPVRHAPAVAMGLFPAIAAWGATVVPGVFRLAGGRDLQAVLSENLAAEASGFLIHGMIIMERGYIFTCMILAAVSAFLIDRRYSSAALWSAVAACFSWLGLMHAYQIRGNNVDYLIRFSQPADDALQFHANGVTIGYLSFAAVFLLFAGYRRAREHARQAAAEAADTRTFEAPEYTLTVQSRVSEGDHGVVIERALQAALSEHRARAACDEDAER